MDVKLYYIEGISRIDTPYFFSQGSQATLAKQQAYFETKRVLTLSTSFYPPHYMNEIKFDIDDVDFTDTVNYLSLTFGGKDYYYFIDAIEYLNEAVIKLHITMDVIQTYMFNIRVSNGIIERKFINRWINDNGTWKINRNYIRENVSEGIFYPIDLHSFNDNKDEWCYIVKLTEWTAETMGSDPIKNRGTVIDNVPTPLLFSILPYKSGLAFHQGGNDNAHFVRNYYASEILTRICQKDFVYDIIALPLMPISGVEVTDNKWNAQEAPTSATYGTQYYLDEELIDNPNDSTPLSYFDVLHSGYLSEPVGIGGTPSAPNEGVKGSHEIIYLKKYTGNINFNFTRNALRRINFSSLYMNILLDSNYNRIIFGSNYANTTFPLEKLNYTYCYYKYFANIESNSLIYCLDDNDTYNDVYRTTIVDTKIIGVTLKNSPWETFVSQNRSRWIGAIGETALDITSKAAMLTIGMGEISSEQEAILTNPKSRTPIRRKLSAKATRQINALALKSETMQKESAVDIASSAVGGVIGQALRDYNNYVKPSGVTNMGDLTALLTKDYQIYYKKERVQDYEVCANFFHRNGYLVNEHVNAIADIFSYVNTRFYFNVLKMSDVDLHLSGVIEDTSTLEIIKDRLNQGLRLWNIDTWTEYRLTVDITDLEPFVRFNVGDTISLLFEDGQSQPPEVVGNIVDVTYDPGPTELPVRLIIETSAKVNIGAATNWSQGIYNGQHFDFDYNNTSWYDPVIHNNIGDFTYDNVELDYLN